MVLDGHTRQEDDQPVGRIQKHRLRVQESQRCLQGSSAIPHQRSADLAVARVYLKRIGGGFVPADAESEDLCKKFKLGEIYRGDVVKPRSYEHHKLIFALLNTTYQNQDRYDNFEDFRKVVAIAAGHSREFVTLDGEIVREAQSISYDALDQVEFQKVAGAMLTVCAHLLHDMNVDELAHQVGIYADQNYGRSAA